MNIDDLLRIETERKASDLHLKVGNYPHLRIDGELVPLTEQPRVSAEDMLTMAFSMMSARQKQKFKETTEIDMAYGVAGLGRFRVNIFQQRGNVGLVLRVIPTKIRALDELFLPKVVEQICEMPRGLVLVTGVTGSGKSTTLAAMVDRVNSSRAEHIITIEDPIEFLHRDKKGYVNQREIGVDTPTFSAALRASLRQDPDVILVGEMRARSDRISASRQKRLREPARDRCGYADLQRGLARFSASGSGRDSGRRNARFGNHFDRAARGGNRSHGFLYVAYFGRGRNREPHYFDFSSAGAETDSFAVGGCAARHCEPATGAALRYRRACARGRGDDQHGIHPRVRAGAGEDAVDSRRYRGRNFAIRHADFRPVAMGSVPSRAGELRHRARKRFQRRRLQAAHAGHCIDCGHFAPVHAVSWFRWTVTNSSQVSGNRCSAKTQRPRPLHHSRSRPFTDIYPARLQLGLSLAHAVLATQEAAVLRR